ncbi:proline-rich protein 4-like [Phragmites australis]|uniref:proline-rich protein 4-like n=1 Tax=Phragmites australis TaxID=29695 RepID=UPI002D775FBC|nr:proline-rich protein 4-like [Phragmites australis]
MGALSRGLLVGVCAVLLAAVFADAAAGEAASMVVGLAKCADCTRKNMKAEAVFKGLQVAVKCKDAHGVFETKAVGKVDKSGTFSVPLAADLLREDGELKQDCFAQLHSTANQPCPGQEPSWIVQPSSDNDKKKTFIAVAGKMHYSSKECASAFLCDPSHKKHLFHKKPIVIPHIPKKPIVIPHIPKKPVPEYKPPTHVPVYHPTPMPTYKPPTPEYSHPTPTPIYHPPADQKTQNPETDPEKFKKLLPFIKKKPFFFPKFRKFPPGKEDIKA